MEPYYFYIVQGDRAGFGIAQDMKHRSQQYSSHSGRIVNFPFVFAGHRPHAKALERTIKTELYDDIWMIEDWRTEWLNDNITIDMLKEIVDRLIAERHYKVECIATNYDFTKRLTDSA
jgi:hypothetical protein